VSRSIPGQLVLRDNLDSLITFTNERICK